MPIPLTRPDFCKREHEALSRVLESGWVTMGPATVEFEETFARTFDCTHAIAMSSATAGLFLALRAHGIGPGHEVLCPSYTFIATAQVISAVGARPVFVDIEADSPNMDPAATAKLIRPGVTKAVLPVHQFGIPARLAEFRSICAQFNLPLIEDAACAVGAATHGSWIGAGTECAVFSFHPRKFLTTGEGGMLVTTRSDLADKIRCLRNFGASTQTPPGQRPDFVDMGFNFRITDLQSAMGTVQVQRFPEIHARLHTHGQIISQAVASTRTLVLPTIPNHDVPNYSTLEVTVASGRRADRDAWVTALQARGMQAMAGIKPCHAHPIYKSHAGVPLPQTERRADSALWIPCFASMTEGERQSICAAVSEVDANMSKSGAVE